MGCVCVGCGRAQEAGAPGAVCAQCGTRLHVDGRYVATGRSGARADGLDEVDGAAPLLDGLDAVGGRRLLMRVAAPDHTARLEREATVLAGLVIPGVPRVLARQTLAGVSVLVMEDVGTPVERALAQGLRTDAQRVRGLLAGLLDMLVRMHALSPPVFHRHIHSGSVCWDGARQVGLRDFARATDTLEDRTTDGVLPRPGFHAPADAGSVQADLYGVGAVALHVLSRRSPETLPLRDGIPDVRAHTTVDEPLAVFLERLLSSSGRRSFPSARAALDALAPQPPAARRGGVLPWVVVMGAMGVGAGAWVARRPPAANAGPPPVVANPSTSPVTAPMAPRAPAAPTPAPTPEPAASNERVQLKVTSAPSGARVKLNGVDVGSTPLEQPVTPVTHAVITVSLPGHATHQRSMVLMDDVAFHVALEAAAAPARSPAPLAVIPAVDDSWRRGVERAAAQQRSALVDCNKDGVDRTRITLRVRADGTVESAQPLGQANLATTGCVKDVLQRASYPSRADHDAMGVDVWVYFKPAFKVAAY